MSHDRSMSMPGGSGQYADAAAAAVSQTDTGGCSDDAGPGECLLIPAHGAASVVLAVKSRVLHASSFAFALYSVLRPCQMAAIACCLTLSSDFVNVQVCTRHEMWLWFQLQAASGWYGHNKPCGGVCGCRHAHQDAHIGARTHHGAELCGVQQQARGRWREGGPGTDLSPLALQMQLCAKQSHVNTSLRFFSNSRELLTNYRF